jgi:hypothetical protein
MDYNIACCIDVVVLLGCFWCVWESSDRSIFNPALWWIGFHTFTITLRLFALRDGARTSHYIGIHSSMELIRAGLAADIALLGITAATVLLSYRSSDLAAMRASRHPAPLNGRLGIVIVLICIPLSLIVIAKYDIATRIAAVNGIDITGADSDLLSQTTYPFVIGGFAILSAVILCAMKGFKGWLIGLLIPLLILTSVVCTRAFFVMPLIMCFFILQTRRRQTSIPLPWMIGLIVLGAVWYIYKPVSQTIDSGGNLKDVYVSVQSYLREKATDDPSLDTEFLDMQATYMGSADELGRRYYGSTVLPLLTLPIPRFLWPEKPRNNSYSEELSTGERTIFYTGMTPNLSGESYLNFGWFGCAFIPFLYMWAMQVCFQRVSDDDIRSSSRLLYMVFLVAMVQIYRDGLNSIFLYPILYMAPLTMWSLLSKLIYKLSSSKVLPPVTSSGWTTFQTE